MIAKYVSNTYKITEIYKDLLVYANDAKVTIAPSDDNSTSLVFFEKKRMPYEFFIVDGTLTIKSTKTKWYHKLRIGIDRSEIKLCVPKSIIEKISIVTNVGTVDIKEIACNGAIDIKINTGNVNLENAFCTDFNSKGNTGALSLNHFSAKTSIFVNRNTGNISLNDCTSPEIFVKTNTGRVSGKLSPNTVFTVHTNTGKVETPKAPLGEAVSCRCEIKTNTGSVKFE